MRLPKDRSVLVTAALWCSALRGAPTHALQLPSAAVASSLEAVASGATHFATEHPLLFGSSLTSVKTAAADVLAQRLQKGRKFGAQGLDARRVGIFASYGFCYLGAVQYCWYSIAFPRLFPHAEAFAALPFSEKLRDLAGWRAVAGQVVLDQGVHWPLVAIPTFYLFKQAGEHDWASRPSAAKSRPPTRTWTHLARTALRKCRRNWRSDVVACWAIWVPACIFNFSVCPVDMRVPFAALVSFVYTAIVSWRRGKPDGARLGAPPPR
mmetsp:Transcript_24083/g.95607  ORF Transcript_24083/g.95607 Transcript_24083/m.95607 type:complete len:266 (+) Transcript_24083:1091-1888(+)